MSKLSIVRRCYSCGKILQSEDPTKEGYLNPKFADASLETILFCDACYHEEKFNQQPHELKAKEGFLTMLEDAAATDALIVYVVDLFSFECSFIPEVNNIIRGSNILVIANKIDLLPKDYKEDEIKEYVAHRFRVAKLSVQASDVLLSSANMTSSKEIADEILKRRKGHDVYCIGAEKAGKTIFLSNFLRHYKNASGRNIITKKYPGTELRLLEIPLDKSTSIYDTPGTPISNTMLQKVESELVKLIIPETPLVPRKESLAIGEALFLGGLARIELLSANTKAKQEITLFFSEDIRIKKLANGKDASKFFIEERDSLYPVSRLFNDEKSFDAYEVKVDETGSRDIGIAGFGWFNFKGDGQVFRIYVPHGVAIYGSRAEIK